MSHRALNWALEQRHLKPGIWIVLIQLADRHNKDTRLVFPEQALLAHDCNVSRATLNRHLSELETLGLVFRVQRLNPATKKHLATHYILQPDFSNPPNIDHAIEDYVSALGSFVSGQTENIEAGHVSNLDTGSVSQISAIPCLKSGDSRVSNCDTNPVREPKREPSAQAGAGGSDFDEFWKVFPKPRAEASCRALFDKAVASGVAAETIIAAARVYASDFAGAKQRYAVGSNDWLFGKGWARHEDAAVASTKADPAAFYAAWICSGKSIPPSAVRPNLAREMLGRKLVTSEQLRKAGIAA
jgi:hypothetical protein